MKYLSGFWKALKMPLFNCKIELKLQLSNYWVLSVARNDNANGNDDNFTFTIKDTKLYDCNWARTYNHSVCKRTLKNLAKLAK